MQRNFTNGCVQRCLMAVPLLLLLSFSYAQKSVQPGRNVTLNNSNISLREVFNIIEKQTGIVLFFMDINTNQQVGVHAANTPVEEVLAEVLNPLGLTYEYVKGNRDKIFIKSVGGTRVVKKDTAQTVMVSGVVTDENGEPLPGASVRVKGTQYGTATKPNGSFILANAGLDNVLQISYTGFVTQEIALNGHTNISIRLKAGDNYLNETVVTAYGTSTRRALTGAITVVSGRDIQNIPNRSFDKSLQGLVPGLLITNGSGQPGAGLSNMVIRGISTGTTPVLGETIRNPLIVIDGVPISQDKFQQTTGFATTPLSNPMAQINPSDIESISVLKDAAAIALYGSKASNGVILLTTKRGRAGKTSVSFRHQTDISNPLNGKLQVLSRDEYLDLLFQTYRNTDPTYWTDQRIKSDLYTKFPTIVNETGDTTFYPASDLKSEIFRRNAPTVANELAISGGGESSNFYLNLEYTKQEGTIRGTDFDRKSLRFNFENRPSTFLKFGLNTAISHSIQNNSNPNESAGAFSAWAVLSPLNSIRLENGQFQYVFASGGPGGPYVNPVAAALYNINRSSAYRGLVKGYTEIKFLQNFTFTTNVATDIMFTTTKEKDDARLYSPTFFTPRPRISVQDIRRSTVITTNTLRFDRTFGNKVGTNILVGQEAQIMNENLVGTVGNGTAQTLPYYDQLPSPGYTISDGKSQTSRQTLASYFGQVNANYENKYIATASIRRDGSSKFGDRQRWGTYWSLGAGWILSEEPVFKNKLSTIDYLKIRGSIGSAGNSSAINQFTRFQSLTLARYRDGNALMVGSSPQNPNIQWESTFSLDAGFEARLLKERVGITIDVYKKKTSRLIYPINLPSISGYTTVLSNIGDMENKGFELGINATIIKFQTFTWSLTGSWSANQNKLIKANVSLAEISGSMLANEEGRNFNSFYMPVWAGVNPENGLPQWLMQDGKPTSNYVEASKQFVGKPQPDAFGSVTTNIRYRAFELSVMAYYQYGAKVYDFTSQFPLQSDGSYPYANQARSALNYWKKPGDRAENPRRMLNNFDMGNNISTRYLYQADYIRLQDVSLAYNFSGKIFSRFPIKASRVYIRAHNLGIITRYNGPDPDNVTVGGATQFAYPNQRTYTIGMNLNL